MGSQYSTEEEAAAESKGEFTGETVKQIQECLNAYLERNDIQTLPKEIMEQVFDFAGIWPNTRVSCNKSVSGQYMNNLHLVSDKFPEGFICRQIEVIVWSHDQGWCSYPELIGTYNGSCTYGELVAIPSDMEHTLEQQLQQQKEYDNPDEDTTVSGNFVTVPQELEQLTKHRVYCNLVARSHWQRHVKVFDMKHELVQGLKSGDRIALLLRSACPGWNNFVKWCQIKVSYVPVE
jgi:hypothetical protein